jgi:adenylate kinase family enzyme
MPDALVIAFAGATKTGKTTISKAVAAILGCGRGSFGDVIRAEAVSQGISAPNRAELQAIGEMLVATRCQELCISVLTRALWVPGALVVLDGVRHVKVVQTLRGLVAPQKVRLVILEATRSERLARMDASNMTLEELQALDAHSTEWEVHNRLPALADLRVCGKSLDKTIAAVVQWVRSESVYRPTNSQGNPPYVS